MSQIDRRVANGRTGPTSRHLISLSALLWLVAGAILVQATLAGLFISATAPALASSRSGRSPSR